MTISGTGAVPSTVGQCLALATERLVAAGIDGARLDARVLIGHSLGMAQASVLGASERVLTADERRRIETLIIRRAGREPISRILGTREFWSLPLVIGPDTLIPRPDSETVVETALVFLRSRPGPLRLLDLGTGTGCLLLALLKELPQAMGVGVDLDSGAVAVAAANARALGLADRGRFVQGDWAVGLTGRFDAVVSNPPYIPDAEIDGLEPEVRIHEPRLALAGGADGLDAYRCIAAQLPDIMADGGRAFLEIGIGAADSVGAILRARGLEPLAVVSDLAGVPRCLSAYVRRR